MPAILTAGSLSARALGHIGGQSRRLKVQTLTSSQTWTAPSSVSLINSIVGEGADGTSASVYSDGYGALNIGFRTDTNTGSGFIDWDGLQGIAEAIAADLNDNGAASWTYIVLYVWPDGKNAYAAQIPVSITDAVPGSASVSFSGGWQTSGAIAGGGAANLTWQRNAPAAAGANTTGFGYTFPGGAVATPATPVTHNNVAVTPGAGYALTIPSGGSITLTYFE